MITLANFKEKLAGKIRGASLDKVANVYGKIGEAGNTLMARIDPETTIRTHRIENAIYDRVYNYTAPSDLKGATKIIDLRPIGERAPTDNVRGRFIREFDIRKEYDTVAVEYVNGTPTLRLSKQLDSHTVLHTCDSDSIGGTVTAGGDASDLTTDTLEHVSGSAALKCTLSGSTGTATLDFALDSTYDLSDLEDLGALFFWLRFPTASELVSVKLSWGTSSDSCWYKTVTAAQDRAFADNAWQLISFPWSTAGKTGTPDASAITWLRVTLSYTGAQAAVYFDNITASLGSAYELVYYSGYLFTTAAGTLIATPTADTDIIMVDSAAENILLYETKLILADEIKGAKMGRDIELANLMLEGNGRKPGLYELYEQEHPTQALDMQTTYYDFDEYE